MKRALVPVVVGLALLVASADAAASHHMTLKRAKTAIYNVLAVEGYTGVAVFGCIWTSEDGKASCIYRSYDPDLGRKNCGRGIAWYSGPNVFVKRNRGACR